MDQRTISDDKKLLADNYAFTGLSINTGSGFAHKDNIEILAPLVEKQIR